MRQLIARISCLNIAKGKMDFLGQKYQIFKNPDGLPLNKLKLSMINVKPQAAENKDEIHLTPEIYPAIHEVFIDEHEFARFVAYDECSTNHDEMVNCYLAKGQLFIESLEYLLACNYHQFWCYILRTSSAIKMLHSFISNFSPVHEWDTMDKQCFLLFSKIHQKVATVLVRLFTFHQSPKEHMLPATTITLLEQAGFLTFPTALNICVLYDGHCAKIVDNIAAHYFEGNRLHTWHKDFKVMLAKMSSTLTRLCKHFYEKGNRELSFDFEPSWYEDVINYYLDAVQSLKSLFMVSGHAKAHALETGAAIGLVEFYEQVIPNMHTIVSEERTLPYDWSDCKNRILHRIALARLETIECFNAFPDFLIDAILTSNERETYMESYMDLIANVTDNKLFLFDYNNIHSIGEQLEIITSCCPELDKMRTNYILCCLASFAEVEQYKENNAERSFSMSQLPSENAACSSSDAPHTQIAEQINVQKKSLSEDEINEKIDIVLDAIPQLGDGFVLQCLEFYEYDPIEVLHAILDNNLHPSLNELSRTKIRLPPDVKPNKPMLAYRGKKPQASDALDVLNDKSDVSKMKERILNTTEASYSEDELEPNTNLSAFSTETAKNAEYLQKSEEVAAIETEAATPQHGFRPFCEDPAKLREQRDATRKHFHREHDVVGKPKGQGQDEKVLENRHKKGVNKSSRGNHNRKGGSHYKLSRGMF